LDKANLSGASLVNANLKGAILDGADLRYADLSGATWMNGSICAADSIGQCN